MIEIDEAIKHCEEVAERQERASNFWSKGSKNYENCLECAKEHRQLATWLTELKQLKEQQLNKGKWVEYCYQNLSCSKCGHIIADTDIDEYKYCPNCGAKMQEVQQ